MAKFFNFKVNRTKLDEYIKSITLTFEQSINKKVADEAGEVAVEEIKDTVAAGNSPILKKGRFAAYRGSYRQGIQRGWIKNKSLRPVNLKLSGDMLRSLQHKAYEKSLKIGYFGPSSVKSAAKEQGHRDGANGQAERPIIPEGNERFNASITDKILEVLEKAADMALRSKLK